ncbi:DUF4294 domain-containing protein [Antarcticibacterium sp. 1MA-6-2]|uniref:DUF4294 domain-containing protein n=1 Tax=Antarcticibacterium sp. 1MA-6-2 TaxID=2908210 RepID=UPI001F483960|nr:DUF4294 domain-containing protein [Antarcticibacterium sp. 1MA-6-2]UJH91455.1 DUF4294 domain-containing protein [Antarcticibacterium sp. 1MA-6-2]
MLRLLIFGIFFIIFTGVRAQVPDPVTDTIDKEYFIILGDTILRQAIDLEEVRILSRLKFKSEKERRDYLILRRKTRKVYPYAKLASERLVELNSRLDQIKSKRDRKRYTKIVQDYIEDQFSAELKKLTRTEGQILVKLIHRQTGVTAYDLIKNLKSGWRAFWYNSTASLFDISLKEEYNPRTNKEDYLIEDILQRSFQAKVLEPQPSALDFNFMELENKWTSSTTSR